MKIPSHINCDHLLNDEEALKIAESIPKSRDRIKMLSHLCVSHAITKIVMNPKEVSVKSEKPKSVGNRWAVVSNGGNIVKSYVSRSKARKACDRSLGQKVRDLQPSTP